jgi:aspartate/methionine/tyrosine aminotransferase
MFSARAAADLTTNRLTQALERRRAAGGAPLIDLTATNPTTAGFAYPAGLLLDAASASKALTYAPEALGMKPAREAVASDFARRGLDVDASRIVLTASTSEAYSVIFKLLCDPEDEVLVPRPSYPLFEHLARLDNVRPRFYDTDFPDWRIDIGSVARAINDRTRAVLAVSPNNPTGAVLTDDELVELRRLCEPRDIAIVVDEVFADYPLEERPSCQGARVAELGTGLAFSLGGLSKTVGLPQMKLGWMAVSGDHTRVARALERLDVICDTYLSVSTPVQLAAASLLAGGAVVREQIQARILTNYRYAREAAAGTACTALAADGGWSVVVRVPTLEPEEDLVIRLLEERGVLAHPGYFFDFPRESFVIASLLIPPLEFQPGFDAILRHFDCKA